MITPEQYAEVIASKIDSSKASQFIPLIATQIRVQSDARKKVWFEENKNEIFYQESSFDKIQTSIKVGIEEDGADKKERNTFVEA